MRRPWSVLVLAALLSACSAGATRAGAQDTLALDRSPYVLPFPAGRAYLCFNSYGGPIGHTADFQYSVDFDMPIGTLVTAARQGTVAFVADGFSDADTETAQANVVVIRHDDSTFARYAHLTAHGALVAPGRRIAQGDSVGRSGSSGSLLNGAPKPHLHFDVTTGCAQIGCQTIPVLFRNALPAHRRLLPGTRYLAGTF